MGYYSKNELYDKGVKFVGDNVKISRKASLYDVSEMIFEDNCRVDDFCVLSGKLHLGKHVHVAVYCNLAGGSEGIVMEDYSGLAYYCNVFTQSDDYTGKAMTNPTIPEKYTNVKKAAIKIKKHCIIGTNSVIFPGVIIEEGASIGAMSLVTKSTEAWTINFGIPAKKIGKRSKELLEKQNEFEEGNK